MSIKSKYNKKIAARIRASKLRTKRLAKAERLYNKITRLGYVVDCADMDGVNIYHTNTKGERVLRRINRILENAYFHDEIIIF